jgi:hypothetical protein
MKGEAQEEKSIIIQYIIAKYVNKIYFCIKMVLKNLNIEWKLKEKKFCFHIPLREI